MSSSQQVRNKALALENDQLRKSFNGAMAVLLQREEDNKVLQEEKARLIRENEALRGLGSVAAEKPSVEEGYNHG